jgi:hypothetical protein
MGRRGGFEDKTRSSSTSRMTEEVRRERNRVIEIVENP